MLFPYHGNLFIALSSFFILAVFLLPLIGFIGASFLRKKNYPNYKRELTLGEFNTIKAVVKGTALARAKPNPAQSLKLNLLLFCALIVIIGLAGTSAYFAPSLFEAILAKYITAQAPEASHPIYFIPNILTFPLSFGFVFISSIFATLWFLHAFILADETPWDTSLYHILNIPRNVEHFLRAGVIAQDERRALVDIAPSILRLTLNKFKKLAWLTAIPSMVIIIFSCNLETIAISPQGVTAYSNIWFKPKILSFDQISAVNRECHLDYEPQDNDVTHLRYTIDFGRDANLTLRLRPNSSAAEAQMIKFLASNLAAPQQAVYSHANAAPRMSDKTRLDLCLKRVKGIFPADSLQIIRPVFGF